MTSWSRYKRRDPMAPIVVPDGWCIECAASNFHRVDCPKAIARELAKTAKRKAAQK